MRDVMVEIAARARTGARVASESPSLASYYAERAKRSDLVCVSLSDPDALKQLAPGDFVIIARGRRYFSNDGHHRLLRDHSTPMSPNSNSAPCLQPKSTNSLATKMHKKHKCNL